MAATPTPANKKAKALGKNTPKATTKKAANNVKKNAKDVPTPSMSDNDSDDAMSDNDKEPAKPKMRSPAAPKRQSGRAKKMSYAETEEEGE